MRFSDAGDVEFEDLLTQEMLDALTRALQDFVPSASTPRQVPPRQRAWVRFQPLLVLMYECIVAGVDYDYARIRDGVREAHLPTSPRRAAITWTTWRRDWFERCDYHQDTQPVVAYQITEEGLERLRTSPLTRQDRGEIDDVIRDPQGALLMVSYNEDDEVFRMHSENAVCVDSTITETEDGLSHAAVSSLSRSAPGGSDGVQRALRVRERSGTSNSRMSSTCSSASAGW